MGRVLDPVLATEWTMEDVGLWLDSAMCTTLGPDRYVYSRDFLAGMESRRASFLALIPFRLRKDTVNLIGRKLQCAELPSLRELVRLQGGSEYG